jgi:peroxiredoxin
MESQETVKNFLEKKNLSLKIVFDKFGQVSAQYGVRSHPVKFLIDGQGKLMATGLGYRDWDSEEMNKLVEILIQQGGETPRA